MALAIYKERAHEQAKRRRFLRDVLPWLIIIALIFGVFCFRTVSGNMREQGVLSIRTSILEAAALSATARASPSARRFHASVMATCAKFSMFS